jgi:hypothetical protein
MTIRLHFVLLSNFFCFLRPELNLDLNQCIVLNPKRQCADRKSKVKGKIFALSSLAAGVLIISRSGYKTSDSFWREDFNYANMSKTQAAGRSASRPSGTSLDNGSVVLDGVGKDTGKGIRNIFLL